ncbi:MAG: class I SAM-dependent methyltransferase [Pseudonocardiales bacterium]|nr:MAG: class I SAM-dependent methyltransferase [Pseudonocardiales bacterium]
MPIEGRLHADRGRAESFGSVADEYDRFRPSYPAGLIEDLVALRPADVLDVGCGTGKAARLLAERGLAVLGVEVDAQMAAVARGHGIDVEIASFESWQAGGRCFDLVTCAQAWHWLDPAVAIPKAASVLRPGGALAIFWNHDELDAPAQAAFDDVYRRHAPELLASVAVGRARCRDLHLADLQASGLFASVHPRTYRWERIYSPAQWLGMVRTHSDHLCLEPSRRDALLDALGAAIDELGGTIASHYGTYTAFARVAG